MSLRNKHLLAKDDLENPISLPMRLRKGATEILERDSLLLKKADETTELNWILCIKTHNSCKRGKKQKGTFLLLVIKGKNKRGTMKIKENKQWSSLFFSTCLRSPAVCPTMEGEQGLEAGVHVGFHHTWGQKDTPTEPQSWDREDTTLPAPFSHADVEAATVPGENWVGGGGEEEWFRNESCLAPGWGT